jgi:hypothetical protein
VIPLASADITTTANVQDNQMHIPLMSSHSLVFSVLSLHYMAGNPGYDAKKLYKYSKTVLGIDLVFPVKRYKSSYKKRLELVCFYESEMGQAIYSQRRISGAVDRTYKIRVWNRPIACTWIS